ncbi:rRNA maturation RNase YbeY [Stieleria marina]
MPFTLPSSFLNLMSPTPVLPSSIDDEEPPSSLCDISVELIVDDSVSASLDEDAIRSTVLSAVQTAAVHRGFSSGTVGVRITDDAAIRQLNAKHLGHDYATDVISFSYEADPPHLEGELVVSVDTARQKASEIGWPAESELLLYIVHGVLHITGMDDHEPTDRREMRQAEESVFLKLGIREISRCGADIQPEDSQ